MRHAYILWKCTSPSKPSQNSQLTSLSLMGNPSRNRDSASLLTLDPEPDAISLAMATLMFCKNGCCCPGIVTRLLAGGKGAAQRHAATKPEVSVLAAMSTHEEDPLILFLSLWLLLFADSCRLDVDRVDRDDTLGSWRTKAVVVVVVVVPVETKSAASKRADRETNKFIMADLHY
jgi:hypothetical protein